RKNSFTAGRIYDAVIKKERAGGYLGKTVQVIPHVTDQIKDNIKAAMEDADLGIIEVGGTVGDIEGLPFLEAIRQIKHEEGASNVLFAHLTLVPYIATAGELKTKPTQHSVKELREIGIQPDILICRTDRFLDKSIKEKIGLFCNVPGDCVFSAPDAESIYDVPLQLAEEGLDDKVVEKLGIWTGRPDLSKWKSMVQVIHHPDHEVKIGIVGKYTDWRDTYKSISESLVHGGVANQARVAPVYIDSESIEKGDYSTLATVSGILVPGGFGERGIEGKIKAIEYARTRKIPFFGICLGMQLATIEFARHVCGLEHANSAEFKPDNDQNVIDLMDSQKAVKDLGGTMRLGAYECRITKSFKGKPTHAFAAYQAEVISERHRHRFEVSNAFRNRLEEKGLLVSGRNIHPETKEELVEMVELPDHPWFLGCQFHPELLSRPLAPHPLFENFIRASLKAKGMS
ncbi:CTP synthase, partial [bacterium]|nr:CTP synthase [bacterium]